MQRFLLTREGQKWVIAFVYSFDEFTAGFTRWQQLILSTEEGELWVLLQAMNEAKHKGFERVQFEIDSHVLIEAIHTKRRGK
jgi:ribonuclease HI